MDSRFVRYNLLRRLAGRRTAEGDCRSARRAGEPGVPAAADDRRGQAGAGGAAGSKPGADAGGEVRRAVAGRVRVLDADVLPISVEVAHRPNTSILRPILGGVWGRLDADACRMRGLFSNHCLVDRSHKRDRRQRLASAACKGRGYSERVFARTGPVIDRLLLPPPAPAAPAHRSQLADTAGPLLTQTPRRVARAAGRYAGAGSPQRSWSQ